MAEKRGRKVRKVRERDRKCWQRIELGIHGLKSWGRKKSRKVRETRSSSSQIRFRAADGKCWQRIELGIHGLKSWGRNWYRKGRNRDGHGFFYVWRLDDWVRGAFWEKCRPIGAEGVTHFRAPGKRGRPPMSPWPLFSRPTPPPPRHYLPPTNRPAKIDVTDKIERSFILIGRS